jgi:hypothetical protein
MNFLKTCLAVLAGFLLCYLLLPPRPVKAASWTVSVRRASIGSGTIVSGNVVGFSCTGSGSDTECYIASQ